MQCSADNCGKQDHAGLPTGMVTAAAPAGHAIGLVMTAGGLAQLQDGLHAGNDTPAGERGRCHRISIGC
jgi:hypothetical protein